jgi:hypothetical protein
MAHDLTPSINYGARYIGMRGESAWHRLGITKAEGVTMTCAEAIIEAGIDFEIISVPVGFTTPRGSFVQSGERVAILRAPLDDETEWVEIGSAHKNYTYLQNRELAAGLDRIAAQTGWAFETAGSLGKGETVFLTLRTGKRSIFGDAYDTFLVVSDGRATGRALKLAIANVRVVCRNTLLMSDSSALASINIAHTQQVAGDYGWWLDMIGNLQAAQDESFAQLDAMASVKIKPVEAKRIIAAALPFPGASIKGKQADALAALPSLSDDLKAMARARASKRDTRIDERKRQATERRAVAFDLYERYNAGKEQGLMSGGEARVADFDLAQLRETPYAVLQAVTELADWCGPTGERAAAEASLFGRAADIKQRAWSEAFKVATKATAASK